MKLGIDIFCVSQASTAIRLTTMDLQQASSSSSSSTPHLGGTRAIDRHNPIIREGRRSITVPIPCTSQPSPVAPIPYKQLHHKAGRKSTSNSKQNDQNQIKKNSSKKSSDGSGDQKKKSKIDIKASDVGGAIVRKSFAKRGDFINGPDSSRYLLGETGLLDLVPDFDPGLDLVPVGTNNKTKPQPAVKTEESSASNANPPPPSRSPDQVVVLRVSLHCRGCEGKVRKHISRMQGVTSFNIDFAAKKVTVVGDVTPLEVLSSISKVKTAQLWTPPMPSSSSLPAASSSLSEIKKSKAVAAGI